MKPGPVGPLDEFGLEGGLSCPSTKFQCITQHTRHHHQINQKKGGHSSFSFTKHKNASLKHSDTYGVAAGVDEIPDMATYQGEVGYTPDTCIVGAEVVADTHVAEPAEAKHWGSSHHRSDLNDYTLQEGVVALEAATSTGGMVSSVENSET